MRQRNKAVLLSSLLWALSAVCWGQALPSTRPVAPPKPAAANPQATQQSPAPTTVPGVEPLPSVDDMEGPSMRTQPSSPSVSNAPVAPSPDAGSASAQPNGTTNQPAVNTAPTNATAGNNPAQPNVPNQTAPNGVSKGSGDVFLFRKKVEEVVLHATVIDDKHHPITNLDKSAFTVYEDGQPQAITSFRREDIPVALGILVDNSGSMRDKREKVSQAALNLIRASNPQDEVFVVNFSDDAFLDAPLTNNVPKLKEALDNLDAKGATAIYDAVVASLGELKRSKLQKKVLLVVTDGEDDASRKSLEQTVRAVQAEDGPVIYTIGILGEGREKRRAQRALRMLSEDTGGVAFFPRDLREVDDISQSVARDIRNQYTIGYKPVRPQSEGGYRSLRVDAKTSGVKGLTVRTRSGYFAGENAAQGQDRATR